MAELVRFGLVELGWVGLIGLSWVGLGGIGSELGWVRCV